MTRKTDDDILSFSSVILNSLIRPQGHYDAKYWPSALVVKLYR